MLDLDRRFRGDRVPDVDESQAVVDTASIDIASEVRQLSTDGWAEGYVYGATRYADVILKESFGRRFRDLVAALNAFHPTLDELRAGGGGRTVFVRRFDDSLAAMLEDGQRIWGKQNITIEKTVELEGTTLARNRTRGHEIDMFGKGSLANPLPGIAAEMEWNNKDPFFDRDLINFQALHREGAIALGVIVTRGPELQALLVNTIPKYGQSTTHWEKLIPRVNLGGGGECPLLLLGIEPSRITGIDLAQEVKRRLDEAERFKENWRDSYQHWADARPVYDQLVREARDLMPPVSET